MSLFIRFNRPAGLNTAINNKIWRMSSTSVDVAVNKGEEEEEFRVLDILHKRQRMQRRTAKRADVQPDRADRMAPDQVRSYFL